MAKIINWLVLLAVIFSGDPVAFAGSPIIWGPSGKAQSINSDGLYTKGGVAYVNETATETLTNKTFTAPIESSFEDFTEIATPATPGAGVLRVYSKSGDGLYIKNSSGTETQLASATAATPTTQGVVSSYVPTIQSGVKTTSTNYTILTTDGFETILVTTGSSTITITLPAVSANGGRTLKVIKADNGSGKITLARAGSDTIGGATSLDLGVGALNQYASVTIYGDGSATWDIISPVSDKVAMMAYLASNVSVTVANPIKFDTTTFDPYGGYNASTGLYTFPRTGLYRVCGGASTTGTTFGYYVRQNSTEISYVGETTGSLVGAMGCVLVSATKNDTVGIYSDTTATVQGGVSTHFYCTFSVEMLMSPTR